MGRGSHATEQRIMRIQRIKDMVKGMGEVELRKLCAICSINLGLSHNKTKEYIEDLVEQEALEMSGDLVKAL